MALTEAELLALVRALRAAEAKRARLEAELGAVLQELGTMGRQLAAELPAGVGASLAGKVSA